MRKLHSQAEFYPTSARTEVGTRGGLPKKDDIFLTVESAKLFCITTNTDTSPGTHPLAFVS